MKKPQRLYRNQFGISVYDQDDDLVFTVDTINEFANMLGVSRKAAQMALQRLYHNRKTKIRYQGQVCSVAFVDLA